MFRDVILSVNDLLQMIEDEFGCRIKRMYWGGFVRVPQQSDLL